MWIYTPWSFISATLPMDENGEPDAFRVQVRFRLKSHAEKLAENFELYIILVGRRMATRVLTHPLAAGVGAEGLEGAEGGIGFLAGGRRRYYSGWPLAHEIYAGFQAEEERRPRSCLTVRSWPTTKMVVPSRCAA